MEFLVIPRWRGGPKRSSLLFQRNEACIGARSSWFLYELLTSSSRILTNLLHIIRRFFFEISSPKIVWRSLNQKLTKPRKQRQNYKSFIYIHIYILNYTA